MNMVNASLSTNQVGVMGEYIIEVLKKGTIVRSYKFKNLVTTVGVTSILSATPRFCNQMTDSVAVSTDNVEPTDITVTTLPSKVSTHKVAYEMTIESDRPNGVKIMTSKYLFDEGQLNGYNICKVGIGGQYQNIHLGQDMFSMALIKDNYGQPTVINTIDDEQLRIIYKLYVKINHAWTVNYTVNGKTCRTQPYGLNNYYNELGYFGVNSTNLRLYIASNSDIAQIPNNYHNQDTGLSIDGYIQDSQSNPIVTYTFIPDIPNKSVTKRIVAKFTPSQGNWSNGINLIFDYHDYPNRLVCFQTTIDPPIIKTPDQTLTITVDTIIKNVPAF